MSKEEKRLYMQNWRAKNKKRLKAYRKAHPQYQRYNPKKYARMLAWRQGNGREKYLEYQRVYARSYQPIWREKYYKLHPEKLEAQKEYHKKYYQDNIERYRQWHRDYYWQHRDRINELRRARRKNDKRS